MATLTNTTHQIGREFILAGRAIFTVSNPTGERYTFKVSKKEAQPGSRYTDPTYFVALLTGSDNESDYTYMGILKPAAGNVILTKASRYTAQSKPYAVVNWAIGLVWRGKSFPAGYRLQHEGKCGRCGRTLTVPESIDLGIGPDCAAMMGLAMPAPCPAMTQVNLPIEQPAAPKPFDPTHPAVRLAELAAQFRQAGLDANGLDSVARAEIALGVQ